jgi:hypothetical protein
MRSTHRGLSDGRYMSLSAASEVVSRRDGGGEKEKRRMSVHVDWPRNNGGQHCRRTRAHAQLSLGIGPSRDSVI